MSLIRGYTGEKLDEIDFYYWNPWTEQRRSLIAFFIRIEIMKSFANFLEYSVDRLNGVLDPKASMKSSVSISVSTHLFRVFKKSSSVQFSFPQQVIVRIFAIFSVGQSLS